MKFLKEESLERRKIVLEKKKTIEVEKGEHVRLMASRGELRRQRKIAYLDVSFHVEKFSQLQKEWKSLIVLADFYLLIKALLQVTSLKKI